MKDELTEKEKNVYCYLREFISKEGRPPTRALISKIFNWNHSSSAQHHLSRLAKKGYIELSPNKACGIKII